MTSAPPESGPDRPLEAALLELSAVVAGKREGGEMSEDLEKIREAKESWEEGPLSKALKRFPYLSEESARFCSPVDLEDFDFLEKVGFPGTYPYTAGTFPIEPGHGRKEIGRAHV